MPLPRFTPEKYTVKLPISGESVEYIPFNVGQQHKVKTVIESGTQVDVIKAMRDVMKECIIGDTDIFNLSLTEAIWLTNQIRIASIGAEQTVVISCKNPDCEMNYEIDIDYNDIEIKGLEEYTDKIEIDEKTVIIAKPPTMQDFIAASGHDMKSGETKEVTQEEMTFELIRKCVKELHHGEESFILSDETDEEIKDWFETLPPKYRDEIDLWYEKVPTLEFEVESTCPKCGTTNTHSFDIFEVFFS